MADLTGHYIERYYIEQPLGEGGMATVYRARDARLERNVAIKVIRKDAFSPEMLGQVLARFEREAKALAQLSHPNIVKVYDFGEYQGSPFLVMEYISGGSLKDITGTAVPWQHAVQLTIPLARALGYAHHQNVIHRDVKPGNILITASGEPMLSDFGIAKILENTKGNTLTGTGVGIGTPEYMAPEQGMGRQVDGRADVYALGIVLYELITGRRPYEADTPMAVVLKHITDALPRPNLFTPGLPEAVEWVLEKALAKDPGERYADMAAFENALVGLLTLPHAVATAVQPTAPASTIVEAPNVQGVEVSDKKTRLTTTTREPRKRLSLAWKIAGGLGLLAALGALAVVAVIIASQFVGVEPTVKVEPSIASSEQVKEPLAEVKTVETEQQTATPTDLVMESLPTATEPAPEMALQPKIPLGPENSQVSPKDAMLQVLVPAGTFLMGSSEDELALLRRMCPGCAEKDLEGQTPQRQIFLDAFWIDQTEVSNRQFADFVAQTGYQTTAERNEFSYVLNIGKAAFDQVNGANWRNWVGTDRRWDENLPVVHVSWADAAAYCEWAGRRLPTEAEWEKSARGESGNLFPWGNQMPEYRLANYYQLGGGVLPVGSLLDGASPYAALDMVGNVYEWVADTYRADYYAGMPERNPAGPAPDDGRVYRGGSWTSRLEHELFSLASTGRKWNTASLSRDNLGFRCAQAVALSAESPPQPVVETPRFFPVHFCAEADCAGGSKTVFAEGIKEVYFLFEYNNMVPGLKYRRRWLVNGKAYLDYACEWKEGWPTNGLFAKRVYDLRSGLAPGEWVFESYLDGELQERASFTVEGAPREEAFMDAPCPDLSPGP